MIFERGTVGRNTGGEGERPRSKARAGRDFMEDVVMIDDIKIIKEIRQMGMISRRQIVIKRTDDSEVIWFHGRGYVIWGRSRHVICRRNIVVHEGIVMNSV